MLDYHKTRAFDSGDIQQSWSRRDTMLYALGVGLALDPLDTGELRYVYEKDLHALPTMAATLASPGFWMRDRAELGIDAMKLVHGEQSVTIHSPLPSEGTATGRTRVTRVVDKGAGKGAIIHAVKELTDSASGRHLATVESVYFGRGDGGFSTASGNGDEPAPPLPAVPQSPPSRVIELPTRPEQALVYRLSGDMNPLHADPAIAARLGLEKPILHGLATWGLAGRAIASQFLAHQPGRLKALKARFSAPVYPGETLRLDCWEQADGLAFQLAAPARGVIVLANGLACY